VSGPDATPAALGRSATKARSDWRLVGRHAGSDIISGCPVSCFTTLRAYLGLAAVRFPAATHGQILC
jgi:hypothetical protein